MALIAVAEIKSEAVKGKIATLLGSPDASEGMKAVATWADEIKFARPDTKPWHFTDIEITDTSYSAPRDCAGDNCAVAQIDKDIAILKDTAQPAAARTEALEFLIHLVGDLHQPLHSSDNHDRGGNDDPVKTIDGCKELHAVWDTAMVDYLMTDLSLHSLPKKGSTAAELTAHDSPLIASKLDAQITDAQRTEWKRGDTTAWVNETFKLSKDKVYPGAGGGGGTPVTLPVDYRSKNADIAEMQLERAGVRLAWVLEQALQ